MYELRHPSDTADILHDSSYRYHKFSCAKYSFPILHHYCSSTTSGNHVCCNGSKCNCGYELAQLEIKNINIQREAQTQRDDMLVMIAVVSFLFLIFLILLSKR